MRDTGIVRKIDELGRIVLPIELRRGTGTCRV
jgi:bifunctional DNA-binding transcriptional regulator/antitoxin component of YhaV-PrlF toxin-antitoxin module